MPPWGLKGGKEGSLNYIRIFRKNGEEEYHTPTSGLKLKNGDVVRIVTANGAGWGHCRDRDTRKIEEDIKNGYLTENQALYHYTFLPFP